MLASRAIVLTAAFLCASLPCAVQAGSAPRGKAATSRAAKPPVEEPGDRIRRAQEAQSRRWDAEMHKMMGTVCRGC